MAAPLSTGSEKRDQVMQTQTSVSEREKIEWAAAELGLERASFLRYAALKVAKTVIE
jgi:uncharacterized protein (DUF1778 family)